MDKFDVIRDQHESVWVGEAICSHSKGEVFMFGGKMFEVITKTDKTFRMKDNYGVSYTYKTLNGTRYWGESKQIKMFESDLITVISVDLLNSNNEFHVMNTLTIRLMKRLS